MYDFLKISVAVLFGAIKFVGVSKIIMFIFCRGDGMDEGVDTRSKSKANIMENLSEDGNYVANISNMVAGRVGNIFGKGIGGLSTKFGGGTSSWF